MLATVGDGKAGGDRSISPTAAGKTLAIDLAGEDDGPTVTVEEYFGGGGGSLIKGTAEVSCFWFLVEVGCWWKKARRQSVLR